MVANLKINLIGPDGSGKTRLLINAGQLILEQGWTVENLVMWSEELVSTIGGHFVNFGPLKIENVNEPHGFSVWDLGGQARYDDVRKTYLEGSHCILAVIDLCRAHSLEILVNTMLKQEVIASCNDNIPICLVGNKTDLRDAIVEKKNDLTVLIHDHLEDIREKQTIPSKVRIKIGPEKGETTLEITKKKIGDRTALKAADLELILFNLLKETYKDDTFTIMNLKLISREFWVTLASKVLQETISYDRPYSILEKANLGTPLLKEHVKEPSILVPIDWSKEELENMIQSSLLSVDLLNKTANDLSSEGLNIRGTLATSAVEQTNNLEAFTFAFTEGINHYKS